MFVEVYRFKDDPSGSMVPVFVVLILVLMAVAGASLDYVRHYQTSSAAQSSADSAVLAYMATYLRTADEAQAKTDADEIFFENLSDDKHWDWKIGPVEKVGDELHVTATAKSVLDTTLLAALGTDEMEIAVLAESAVPIRSVSAVVVADVSWSMKGARLDSVKDAMDAFADSMYNMVPEFKSQLQMSIVPYSGSVNISQASTKASKLLAGWQYGPSGGTSHTQKSHYRPGGGCSEKHIESISGGGKNTTISVAKYKLIPVGSPPVLKCMNYDNASYAWSGCLQTSEKEFSSSTLLKNGSVLPMPPTIESGSSHCPPKVSAMRVNVKSKSQYKSYVNALDIGFATAHDVGLLWGQRVLEPKWESFFSSSQRPWKNDDYPKFMVFLSDGKARPIKYSFGEYPSRDDSSIEDNAEEICDTLKDNGVRILGISFDHPKTPGNVETVESCASDDEHYKADETNIEEVFEQLAVDIKVREIRLVR